MIGYSKRIEKIIRESDFDEKKKKPGLKFNLRLALTGLRTTGAWIFTSVSVDSTTRSYLFTSAKVRIGVHSTPKYGTKQVTLGIKKVDQENIMFPRYFLSNLRSRHAVSHIPYAYTHQAPVTQAIYSIFFPFFFFSYNKRYLDVLDSRFRSVYGFISACRSPCLAKFKQRGAFRVNLFKLVKA